MDNESRKRSSELSARDRWENLWNALSEEVALEKDSPYPEAEQVKHSLLRGVAQDARAQLTPSELSTTLERAGGAAKGVPEPLGWPKAQERDNTAESKEHRRETERERDTDLDR